MSEPVLTVVVTVVDGDAALRRCLEALAAQKHAPSMEVLVPVDVTAEAGVREAIRSSTASSSSAATVRLVAVEPSVSGRTWKSAGEQHELIDRRRSAGLADARGGLVAIVEDRAVPRTDWAATIVRLHREHPNLVIGGAIENGRDRTLNWAVYYCDFGRYQLPFEAGVRRYVSDVNVTYKRHGLELTRDVWRERYHEPLVHWALEQAGEHLLLSPDLIVDEIRDDLRLRELLAERVAWGRLFGSLRTRQASVARRLAWTVISPVVPLILFARFVRDRLTRDRSIGHVLATAPATLLMMCAWAAGEAAGYLAGEARR